MNLEKYDIQLVNALTISERESVLKNVHSDDDNISIWRSIRGRLTEKQFEYKLRSIGYTNDEFNNIIQNLKKIHPSILDKLIKEMHLSDWYKNLNFFCEYWISRDGLKGLNQYHYERELMNIFDLLVEWAVDKIRERVNNKNHIYLDARVYGSIRESLYGELVNLSAKTLVYEFNENKKAKKDRYTISDFVNEKFDTLERFLAFFAEYPPLLRRIIQKSVYFSEFIIEMLDNIDSKINVIKEKYGVKDNKLIGLSIGKGDSHLKGKSTIILTFNNKRIVYKPHSCELQKAYNEVLLWCNRHEQILPFYITNDMYFDDFVLCEYIENETCIDSKEVERFYYRVGQQLALLYFMGASDMHCENVIAKGEFPVIIDHETFFNNMGFAFDRDDNAFTKITEIIGESVVNSGILPVEIKGINYGALAKRNNEERIKYWVCSSQDDENIAFEYMDMSLTKSNNLPILNGNEISSDGFEKVILSGFKEMFNVIGSNRDDFSKILSGYKKSKVRIVLQSTQNYSDIYQYASHPKYMCDMLSLEKLFENLWIQHGSKGEHFKFELLDAHNCDIPIFYAKIDETSLYVSDNTRIDNYFYSSSWEKFEERLNSVQEKYKLQITLLQKNLHILEECIIQKNVTSIL